MDKSKDIYMEDSSILSQKIELLNRLIIELPHSLRVMLTELEDLNHKLAEKAAQKNYIEGFKLGLRLGIELLPL